MDSSQVDLVADDFSKFRYGWFGFTPKWLQWLNSAKWFVFFLFLANTVQSFVANGLVGVVLSTLEKRFGLTSTQSSWIAGTYDLAGVPMIIIISYIGSRAHRPRWTALGELAVCLGAIIFVLPHYTTDEYLPDTDLSDELTCSLDQNSTRTCDAASGGAEDNLRGYLALFIIARIIMGMGAEPLFTHAVTYLDDVVTKQNFSLYIVFCYIGGVLGPAIAYVAGGYVLTIYTDFKTIGEEIHGLEPSDPRWVGAWWLNFLLGAICMLLVALPFAGYSRDLPGAAEIRKQKTSEAHNAGASDDTDDVPVTGEIHLTLAEIPGYLKYLVTNVTYMGMVVFGICDAMLVAGFAAFGPKYVETQFGMTPSFAAMIFGLVTIPGGVGGLLVGGGIIKKMNLTLSSILKFLTVFTILTLTTIFMFFLRCEGIPFAGVTTPYNGTSETQLISQCNLQCHCDNIQYSPICGIDNQWYFSPCHAGCLNVTVLEDGMRQYSQCSCVTGLIVDPDGGIGAFDDACHKATCKLLPVFLVAFLLAMFFLFAGQGMVPSVVMRCVLTSHRTVAIGLQGMLSKLMGGLAGPLVFGLAFDMACIQWDKHCGKTGSCLTYDSWSIALNMFLLCSSAKVLSLVAVTLSWRFYVPPKDDHPPMELIGPPELSMNDVRVSSNQNGGLSLHMSDPTEKQSSSEFEEDITEGINTDNFALDYKRIMSEL